MMAISAALAFGPAMDAARSPERRVKMKLTTRTVRHTRAASHNLRTMNKTIADNYDSEPVTASSDVEPLHWRHRYLPVFSAYAHNISPICPSLQQRPPLSLYTSQEVHRVSSFATGGRTRQGNLSDARGRKNRQRFCVRSRPT